MELEHQSASLFFKVGSETAQNGVEKMKSSVNAKNGMVNYQKWFLALNKIIFSDFRLKFSIFPTAVDQKCKIN